MNTIANTTESDCPTPVHRSASDGLQAPGSELSPAPWPDPVDAASLLNDLAAVLRRFAVLPPWAAETLALWTLHTYAFQLRDVSTYIGLESPEKRCGKTTLLRVLAKLVHRPAAAANISSPAFFRVIQDLAPTLLIDEADTFLQGNEEMRGILNAGYTRDTAYVMRVAPLTRFPSPKHRKTDDTPCSPLPASTARLATFSCWCPKIMAGIGRLPETLADRSIVIRIQRKTAAEQCERLRTLDAVPLQRQCARFVADNQAAIAAARPELPKALNDRAADIWKPLLALADLAGGDWPKTARQAAASLSAAAQANNPIGCLLLDICLAFILTNSTRIFTRNLLALLNTRLDRPWAEPRGGREINEIWLGNQLRPYGIHPRTMRSGEYRAKGYFKDDFQEASHRYIPLSEIEALRTTLDDQPENTPTPPPQQ